jgi:uncharacterized protein
MTIDPGARIVLMGVARSAIDAAVRGTDSPVFQDAPILHEQRGVFVTVKHTGHLRGCIGRIEPDEPLVTLLPAMAVLSATGDPRFPPVRPHELGGLRIEISLLTVPAPLTDPTTIQIGRHGVIVSARGRRALLLPQVAAEHGWTAPEFLAQVCMKASLAASAWRGRGVDLLTFETDIIEE